MTFKGTIYLALCVSALLVGIHQSTVNGFAASYWIFMFMIVFLILYQMDKNTTVNTTKDSEINQKNGEESTSKKKK